MTKERPPFRVNSWDNFEKDIHGEVWWNGKDGYNLYINGERLDTWYVYQVPEWTPTHCDLLAVGEACKVGYKKVMGTDWDDDMALRLNAKGFT
jgi:hypothetical protein